MSTVHSGDHGSAAEAVSKDSALAPPFHPTRNVARAHRIVRTSSDGPYELVRKIFPACWTASKTA